jgi:hypothetical protein
MPRTSNGIGTWFCKASFDAGWKWDDAVECAMFVYFPVWPLRVVHMRDKSGDTYEAFPLRWSDQLVQHVMIRRWLTCLIGVGVFLLLTLGLVTLWPPKDYAAREWAVTKPILTPLAPCLVAIGIVGIWLLRPRCRRERDIRRVLGAHALGTSDPASWVDEDLGRVPKAPVQFGTATFSAAVPSLLAVGCWTGAMWAARLSAALEDKMAGDELTEQVLRHAGTQEALGRFRRDRKCWHEAMGAQALADYWSKLGGVPQAAASPGGPGAVATFTAAREPVKDDKTSPGV